MTFRSRPLHAKGYRLTWRAALVSLIAPALWAQGAASSSPPSVTPGLPEPLAEIERTEAVIETFADALHELADRLSTADWKGAERSFAAQLDGHLLPTKPDHSRSETDWLERRTWSIGNEARPLAREQLVASLQSFLAQFAKVDRLAFEVVGATLEPTGGLEGTTSLSLSGRNRQGQREWVQGLAKVAARAGEDGSWQITSFAVESLWSLVAARDLFTDVTEAAGLSVPPDLSLTDAFQARRQWLPNGAAAVDVDRDGLLDLFVTGPEENRLYLNQGDGTFKDGAARAGLKTISPEKPELNPVFLDYDNDGDSDLFITSVHENLLLENRLVPDGRTHFRDVSPGIPQAPEAQGWSVAVGDVNRDSLPDLYVTSYLSPFKGPFPATTVDDATGGQRSLLLFSRGDGTFEEARGWGAEGGRFAMGAQLADFDGDHDLDLYVANDYGGGNFLYVNQGQRFVDQASERGALHAAESMGVSFSDYDNDGDLDLHVTNMSSAAAQRVLTRLGDSLRQRETLVRQWSGNALLQNQGDGTFRDVSSTAGPFLADWAWGGGFIDIDNDGWEDLHTPNGFLTGRSKHDMRSMIFTRVILALQLDERAETVRLAKEVLRKMGEGVRSGHSFGGWASDRMYVNRSDGRFLDISGVSGADTFPSDARSTVYADFDNDGDLDIFLRATHGRSHFLFRNEAGQDRGSLRVALEGRASGRDAFGAVVRVKTRDQTLTRAKHGNNGYLDQSDPRLIFGLGKAPAAEWIEVRWPSGLTRRYPGPFGRGASLLIVEGEEKARAVEEKRFRLPGATGR